MTHPIVEMANDPAGAAAAIGHDATVGAAVGGRTTATGDTPGRPGSTTKVLTATAVMQCVDDGLVDLDTPANRFVAHLDPRITIQHLLTHSSGLDAGDVFVDTGDGADAIERYVELLADVPQLFEPGRTFSYNNAGVVIAGHIAALVRGMTYEDVLRTYVFAPAEMRGAAFVGEDNGHAMCTRALAPAGGTLQCTVEDLVRFATTPLVRPETAARMRTLHVTAPGGVVAMAGSGLGWQVWRTERGESIRHAGGYPGHTGYLALADDVVLAILAPSPMAITTINALIDPQAVVVTDEPPVSLDAYVGTYGSHAMELHVQRTDDGLAIDGPLGTFPVELVDRSTATVFGDPFAFCDFDDDGAPRLLRWRMRVQARR
jgi:CubicO group peptidase (beta-lactamase class C family)